MGKVLGLAPGLDRPPRRSCSRRSSTATICEQVDATLREAGVDPEAPRIRALLELCRAVQGLPRHLGQHSGGIVIAAGRARRGRADRARVDAGPPRRAVGQGRLRRPRHHQDRPARPRHARGARRHDPADRAPRGAGRDRSRGAPARRSRDLRDDPARRHDRHLPDREPRADGDAAAHEARELLRPRRRGRDHPAGPDHRARWCTPI